MPCVLLIEARTGRLVYTACMRIGIDVREACRSNRTGKGQWTFGFVNELLQRPIDVTLYTDADLPDAWRSIRQTAGKRVDVVLYPAGLRWHVETAYALRRRPVDAYVSTVSYIVPFLVGKSTNVIPVVHDLVAFMGEPHDRKATLIERMTLGRCVRKARFICTVSDTTKKDLMKRYRMLRENHIVPLYAAPARDNGLPWNPDGKTVLMIGTLSPRKNQLKLIEAFASLPEGLRNNHRLVLIGGRGWRDGEIVRRAAAERNVEWMGYQPDDVCDALLSSATVFAYPSLYEGFGLPVLDAMQKGVPVLTSDHGSLGEIASDAAVFVDPENTASIREGLIKILTDEHARQTLSNAGKECARRYSWARSVDLFLHALDASEGV